MTTENTDSLLLTVKEWRGGDNSLSVYVFKEREFSHVVLQCFGDNCSSWVHLPPELKITNGTNENILWSTGDGAVSLAFKQFEVSRTDAHAGLWLLDIWDRLKTEFFPALTEAIELAAKLREEAAS